MKPKKTVNVLLSALESRLRNNLNTNRQAITLNPSLVYIRDTSIQSRSRFRQRQSLVHPTNIDFHNHLKSNPIRGRGR